MMMKNLLSLLGLDARVRRWRMAAGEGVLAAEDRVQLLLMACEEERRRLHRLLLWIIAAIGLTTVAVALISVAVVVGFWDTPYRTAAAWCAAGAWTLLWLLSLIGLLVTLRRPSAAMASAHKAFRQDWGWIQAQISRPSAAIGTDGVHGALSRQHRKDDGPARELTREELLDRIARQRERIAALQAQGRDGEPGAKDASAPAFSARSGPALGAAALHYARAHPVATALGTTGVIMAIGPRRVARWAQWIVPILWRMR
ncbi:MAG: phage holin family protein [Burkholderiaceae bacterium]|nr:phage holin family protein [Burkholderiaceae bacterium]